MQEFPAETEAIFLSIKAELSGQERVARAGAAQWIESMGRVGQNLETLQAYNSVYTKF